MSRTDFIGDVVLATPLFEALKKRWPEARVIALVRPAVAELLEGHPFLEGVVTLPENEKRLAEALRPYDFDTAVVVYPRWSIAWACWRAGIPRRIGTSRRWYSWLFSHGVALRRRESGTHELLLNFELVKGLGVSYQGERPAVAVKSEDEVSADRMLSGAGIGRGEPFVVIHPGSRGSAGNWPPERYGEFARTLLEEGKRVVVTGGPEERGIVNRMLRSTGKDSIPEFCGRTTLRELAALLKRSRVAVSASTGPMHLAAAVGAPTVSLFPHARQMSPARWGPWGNRAVVIQPDREGQTVDTIPVERVVKAVQNILHGK